jgi:hypothetical protein
MTEEEEEEEEEEYTDLSTEQTLPPTRLLIPVHQNFCTLPVCTAVFLKMNPRFRNM